MQLSGAANNSIISGEKSIFAKQGETVQWIVTAKPKNADFEFDAVTDVTLSGSGVTIQAPTAITNDNLVFLISYTVQTQNITHTLTVGGTGADLIFEVNLLTISVGDAVTNGTVSPALATYTTAGANNLNVTISPVSTHYIDPGLILANVTGLTQAAAITSSTITKNVIVRNYGSNKYAIDDISNSIDYLKQPILVLTKGKTYKFDQSDSSNSGHPAKFSFTT